AFAQNGTARGSLEDRITGAVEAGIDPQIARGDRISPLARIVVFNVHPGFRHWTNHGSRWVTPPVARSRRRVGLRQRSSALSPYRESCRSSASSLWPGLRPAVPGPDPSVPP